MERNGTIKRLPYSQWRGDAGTGTTVGQLEAWPQVYSPELERERHVVVWLPPSYMHGDKRYPVLYMHDGQNLFDAATSFAGVEWQADETMTALASEGIEAIIVGVWNTEARSSEYNPFPSWWNGTGDKYVAFLADTLKPLIDGAYRTQTERKHTAILGSSLGGLVSLFAFFKRRDVFGLCGALSPAFWLGGILIYRFVRKIPFVPGRIYLDHGTRETSAAKMRDVLIAKGYQLDRDLRYVREEGGEHNEAAWARRLPGAIRFLLA